MGRLDVRLLGGFEARFDTGQKVSLPTRKAEALLAYLALAPGKTRSRDQLASLLWSDRADAQARSSLRQALTSLRHGLEVNGYPVLASEGEGVYLEPDVVSVDVLAFEKLAANGSNGNLARAEKLYQGALLDGLGVRDPAFNEWLDQERRRLHELAIHAVDRLLAGLLRAGDHEAAAAAAQRLLGLDPLRESTYRTLMRLMRSRISAALRRANSNAAGRCWRGSSTSSRRRPPAGFTSRSLPQVKTVGRKRRRCPGWPSRFPFRRSPPSPCFPLPTSAATPISPT